MQIQSKLPNVGTTIFTVMSGLAREHNAINLSQGFPDFDPSPQLLALSEKYLKSAYNQYAPMQGSLVLRERISEILFNCYDANYDPDTEITITAGATQGIYTCVTAFVKPGDEVIVFEPAYDCYVPAIELQGAKVVYCSLKYPDFSVDWTEVKNKISSRTSMIIINSPHNPSGAVLSKHDLQTLEELVKDKNIIVVSDEVYEHMVFDNQLHESIARFDSLRKQSLIVSSFGKTVHTTGWKIGYVAAPKALMAEFRKVHQFLVFAVNHPLQLALADFLSAKESYAALKDFYQAKRDYFLKMINGSRFETLKCSGTYFQSLSYKKISEEADTDMAIRLTKEFKLASIPLSVFYKDRTDNKVLRFCFAKKEETLERAAEIICKI
jgi:methionine aminotransferase